MEYISVFIVPFFVIVFLWITYGHRDAYRKAKENFSFMLLIVTVLIASAFFLARSSNEIWEVSNSFSWVATAAMLLSIWALLTMKNTKPKKYAGDFDILEQETMYETGVPLDAAYHHRVTKYDGGKPSKLTTINIDLDVVDKRKDLLPHIKKEIIDITNGENINFYDYGITRVDPLKVKLEEVEKGLSLFYKAILNVAQTNLTQFKKGVPFSEALKENEYVIEYAILYILEKSKAIKNTPVGNLGSLVKTPQDEHMLGACGSVGFTSVGRYGIAIYVGYKLLWHEKLPKN